MKGIINLSLNRFMNQKSVFLIIVLVGNISGVLVYGQPSVSGRLLDQKSGQPVPSANVVLYEASDSAQVEGTISGITGQFSIDPVTGGNYRIEITSVGYLPLSKTIEISGGSNYDFGVVYLQENMVDLEEAVVVGERLKAKTENDKTIYFITKKMVDASNTGTDVLKLIPGVQIDLMHNISLEGSQNILILVDGKERDRNFVSQINPKQIDKVEVMSAPPSKYDANISGAINIVLKKDIDSGISGLLYAEMPTSSSEIFLRPAYNFSYGLKKLNFYTSYNGELTYFDIIESSTRKFTRSTGIDEIRYDQDVRQKNWSHRFHFGFDYFLNTRNQINFYAFYNPYSWEHDGLVELQFRGSETNRWLAEKNDTDINKSAMYSVYFKHLFKNKGSEITFDASNYFLKAENTVTYTSFGLDQTRQTIKNNVKPRQDETNIKVDFTTGSNKKLSFGTGVKARFRLMNETNSADFNYSEDVMAAYLVFGYKQTKYEASVGLRLENSVSDLKNKFRNTVLSLLPYASLNVKLPSNQGLQISFNRTVYRPRIYQLNPSVSIDDPYSTHQGNPLLNPEFHHNFYVEHSIRFNNNFFSTRFFYNNAIGAINNLTFINDGFNFETSIYNLGAIHQYGLQCTGVLKLGKKIIFNPYFRVFGNTTTGNFIARRFDVYDRQQLVFESSFSTLLSLKHDMNVSFTFQYGTPKNNIQGNSFTEALYFLSFEKTFKKKFKAGIVSALPFNKTFIYQGAETFGSGFYSRYEGVINLSDFFAWFKLSYQFSSGKNREKINRSNEEYDNNPKKGF